MVLELRLSENYEKIYLTCLFTEIKSKIKNILYY